MARVRTLMMPAMHMLAALVILASSQEERNNRELLGQDAALVPDVIKPEYDSTWKAVEPSLKQQRNEEVDWRLEPDSQESPKRRRPGRKRKRRPPQTGPDDPRFHYGGSPPNDLGLITGPYDQRERALLRLRPEESRQRYQMESDEIPRNGPHRRRGHRRKQRPLLPDLENSHKSYSVNQREREYNTERPLQENEKLAEDLQSGNRDVSDTDSLFPEPTNEEMEFSDVRQEGLIKSNNKEPIIPIITVTEQPTELEQEEVNSVPHDKSYRKPYSIAKKQNQAMNSPSDLKSLLKQSGGLSLSELLQQRNLSLADLLTGKRQALSALTSTANDKNHEQKEDTIDIMDERVIPLTVSEPSSQSLVIDLNKEQTISKDITTQSSSKELEEERVIPLTEQYTTTTDDSDLGLDDPIQEVPRRLPPVIKKSKKDESANIVQNQTFSIQERDPNDNSRKRLAAMQSRRNLRQRIKQPKIESTTHQMPVRAYNRYNNFISPHPRRKEATLPAPSNNSEEISNTSNDSKNLVDSIVDDDTFETTTEISTTTVLATTYQAEREIPEEKPRLRLPALRPGPKHIRTNSELRRKHSKYSVNKEDNQLKITEPETLHKPGDAMKIEIKDLFGMSNLVLTNKNTQKPLHLNEYLTDIDGSMPLDLVGTIKTKKVTIPPRMQTSTTIQEPKQESAKDEIWEILRDSQGGARLAKILSDRNMTINELVELRERGSSHVHLADIFHNASREPNPPEPFLSKSLIEPISRETYPLRALLEANIRDPTLIATHDPIPSHLNNAPLFVDYARNLRVKDENLDIITLFKEIANVKLPVVAKNVKKDSEGTTYFASVMNIKASEDNPRQARSKYEYSNNQQSTMYSSLPSFIEKLNNNIPEKVQIVNLPSITPSSTTMKSYHVRDVDGDGLIVLGDLQKLDEIHNTISQATNDKLEVEQYDDSEEEPENRSGLLNKLPASVRSATIASASVVGMSMALFLVTYVVYKCRQKKKNLLRRGESFHSQSIPTPVFERRPSNRNRCSVRSISPILVTRVYSDKMDTFDSQSAKETQDYLWDYLRKPFR